MAPEYEHLEDVTVTFRLPQAQPLSRTCGPAPFLSKLSALRRVSIVVECKDRRRAPAELEQLLWNTSSLPAEIVTSIVITGEPLEKLPLGLRNFTSLTHLQASMDWWGQDIGGALMVATLGVCRS